MRRESRSPPFLVLQHVSRPLPCQGYPPGDSALRRFCPLRRGDKKERARILEELRQETRTIIVYEAPHHLVRTLEDLYKVLGDRNITICRELTKKYETAYRTTFRMPLNTTMRRSQRRVCHSNRRKASGGAAKGADKPLGRDGNSRNIWPSIRTRVWIGRKP